MSQLFSKDPKTQRRSMDRHGHHVLREGRAPGALAGLDHTVPIFDLLVQCALCVRDFLYINLWKLIRESVLIFAAVVHSCIIHS